MIDFDKPSQVYKNLDHLRKTVTEELILRLFDTPFDCMGESLSTTLVENAEDAEQMFSTSYEGYEIIGDDYIALQGAYDEVIYPLQPWLPKDVRQHFDELIKRHEEWEKSKHEYFEDLDLEDDEID